MDRGSIRGVELLLRLEGEDGDLSPPGSFIPAAERYGLMPAIDCWVVSHAFEVIGQWLGQPGAVPAFFTINLSGASFRQGGFVDHVRAELERTGVDPHRICFEITETVAIKDVAAAQAFMQELKDSGCRFALDDFGAGMSSFAYLKTLPVDFLKIDGHFVRNICNEPTDRAIVEAIVAMARALGKQTIAEKVEDAATVGLLQSLGIDWVQGFGIGRPQPIPLVAAVEVPLQPASESRDWPAASLAAGGC